MAKTPTTTVHTRSIEEIAEDFANVSDTGDIRLIQAKLTYEYVGSTEGSEAAELRDKFRKVANEALGRKHESLLSDPAVTNLVNTWKYLLRANVDTDPATNPNAGDIAKAAFNFAGQTFRGKEENYVIPAIEAILNGAEPVKTFNDQKDALLKAKKADNARKAAQKAAKQAAADKEITFDSLVAMLKTVSPENVGKYSAEQKSTVRDLLANLAALVA